ncbi:SURF1 family protein [Hydrogenophaga sp.]|uniref:SURF1 family protein n=1 Tax=Hydrogenophaga sp. TaxID=1904254 RepID=UPI003F6AFE94
MSSLSGRFWVVTLATAFTMGVTASLGMWQLDRASQKQALQDQVSQRSELASWTERDLLEALDPKVGLHRSVQLKGQWVTDFNVFLDNRQMDGRVGFFVVTPMRLFGSDRVILIQRGWVPRDFNDRSRVPAVETPEGVVQVEGRLAPAPGKLFEFGAASSGPIRQNIGVAELSQETGLALLDVSVLQTGDPTDGLHRNWPRITEGVHKHHGYAFQWFGLCALAGILYVWFQFISPRRKRTLHGQDAR